ncbi:hypothetical protein A20C1_09129 [marine actinobacterium PHSC20C1]|nr:hypothetical protein A20C1_09129 [marine actinobacterium PHSC20C1]
MWPGCAPITTMRSESMIASGTEWVTNMTALRLDCQKSSRPSLCWSRFISSSAENGSSMSRTLGSKTNARAIATRCCIPPDSCPGYLSRAAPSPKDSKISCGSRRLRLAFAFGFTVIGNRTLSSTVRHGSRAGDWGTRPIILFLVAAATVIPSTITVPLSTGSRPATALRSVDFPQPLGPMTETNSPILIERLT